MKIKLIYTDTKDFYIVYQNIHWHPKARHWTAEGSCQDRTAMQDRNVWKAIMIWQDMGLEREDVRTGQPCKTGMFGEPSWFDKTWDWRGKTSGQDSYARQECLESHHDLTRHETGEGRRQDRTAMQDRNVWRAIMIWQDMRLEREDVRTGQPCKTGMFGEPT